MGGDAYFSVSIAVVTKSTRWKGSHFGNPPGAPSTQISTLREEPAALQTGDWLG